VTSMTFVALVAARWVQFLSAMILLGTSLFPFYALPSKTSADTMQVAQSVRRAMAFAALASAASALAWVAASIVNIGGDVGGLIDRETLSDYFFETSFGKVWALRLVLATVLMALVLLARRGLFARNGATGLVAVLASALLVSQAWIGHPASLTGPERWVVTAAYAIHMLGAGVWLGALLPLGLLLARARRSGEAGRTAEFALRRFSPVGMIAVSSILVGGVINVISRAASFDAFVTSTWGQIVLIKIAIFSAMIVVAALNRFVLMPLLSTAQPEIALARLARNVTFEQVAGLLILTAAAILGVFHPPHFHLPH
jgi:copper resistance protein D